VLDDFVIFQRCLVCQWRRLKRLLTVTIIFSHSSRSYSTTLRSGTAYPINAFSDIHFLHRVKPYNRPTEAGRLSALVMLPNCCVFHLCISPRCLAMGWAARRQALISGPSFRDTAWTLEKWWARRVLGVKNILIEKPKLRCQPKENDVIYILSK